MVTLFASIFLTSSTFFKSRSQLLPFRTLSNVSLLAPSIEIAIVAARKRKEVIEHILLAGLGGLGKTHLLNAICDELGYYKAVTQGNRLTVAKVKDFLVESCELARQASKPAFIIIDEIHEMSDLAQDELFYPMDKGQILTLGEAMHLGPLCIAGATTDIQELNGKSLVDRFVHDWRLEELEIDELMTIVGRFLLDEGMDGEWMAMQTLAERSRGAPCLVLKYSRRARDYAQYSDRRLVTVLDVERMFAELGIDSLGLDKNQRQYLTILYESDKPVSKEALASMLGEMRPEQLTRVVEPYLWRQGFIASTSRGRSLTDKGFRHLAREEEVFSE